MKHYYYENNDQQLGPFTFEELKSKRLKKSALVWTDGLEKWIPADQIEELKDILVSEPPPLPKKPPALPITNPLYDNTYKKDITPIIVAAIMILITIIIAACGLAPRSKSDYNIYIIFSLGIRIWFTIWSVEIAKKLNRDAIGWGIFTFFLPGIALLIISLQKKLAVNKNKKNAIPRWE